MLTDLNEVIGNKLLSKHANLYISTTSGVREISEVDAKTFKVTCYPVKTSKRKIYYCNGDTAVFNSPVRAERCFDKVK